MNEINLTSQIKDKIDKYIAQEDRKAFVECITKKLEGTVFPSYPDIEAKYVDILHLLINEVVNSDETEGLNIHLLTAALRNEYLLH